MRAWRVVAVGLVVLLLVIAPIASTWACPPGGELRAVRANTVWDNPRFDDSWREVAVKLCRVHRGAHASLLATAEKDWVFVTVSPAQLFNPWDGPNEATGHYVNWCAGWIRGNTFG